MILVEVISVVKARTALGVDPDIFLAGIDVVLLLDRAVSMGFLFVMCPEIDAWVDIDRAGAIGFDLSEPLVIAVVGEAVCLAIGGDAGRLVERGVADSPAVRTSQLIAVGVIRVAA